MFEEKLVIPKPFCSLISFFSKCFLGDLIYFIFINLSVTINYIRTIHPVRNRISISPTCIRKRNRRCVMSIVVCRTSNKEKGGQHASIRFRILYHIDADRA